MNVNLIWTKQPCCLINCQIEQNSFHKVIADGFVSVAEQARLSNTISFDSCKCAQNPKGWQAVALFANYFPCTRNMDLSNWTINILM